MSTCITWTRKILSDECVLRISEYNVTALIAQGESKKHLHWFGVMGDTCGHICEAGRFCFCSLDVAPVRKKTVARKLRLTKFTPDTPPMIHGERKGLEQALR